MTTIKKKTVPKPQIKFSLIKFLEKNKVFLTLGILILAALTYFGIKPNASAAESSKDETIQVPSNKEGILYERYSGILKEGEAFVDSLTNATIGISEVNYYKQISGNIKLPNKENEAFKNLMPGHSWTYTYNDKMYMLIYVLGDFMSDEYAIKVIETNQK